MNLFNKCENYVESVNESTNEKIYELCFFYVGGFYISSHEITKLKTFFNLSP